MTMFNLKIYGVKNCVSCSAICPPNPRLWEHISMDLSWCLEPVGKFNSWVDALPKMRGGFCSRVLAHQRLANAISWRETFNCSNIDFYGFHSHCHRCTSHYLQAEAGLWLQLRCQGSLTDHTDGCVQGHHVITLCAQAHLHEGGGWVGLQMQNVTHKLILERKV